MGQSDDVEDSTYSKHQELCKNLNMDATAASAAWKSYSTIRQNYTLEVRKLRFHFNGPPPPLPLLSQPQPSNNSRLHFWRNFLVFVLFFEKKIK